MSSNNLTNDNNNSNRDNAIIDLSVSGTTFTVPRSILTDRQWMLSNIASDHANSDEDIKTVPWGTFHNGKYFIDTDPKAFRWILHFIRHGSLPRGVFESSIEADALLDVADYLCYEELVTYICGERKEVMEYEERVLKLEREHSTKVKQMNKRYRELIKCVAMRARVDSMRRKFRGPVVGPLGAYLKIVEGKEHLAEIAETAIGHGLGHFVVTNGEDRALFMKLRQDVNCSSRECGVLQLHQGPRCNIPPPPMDGIETVASVLSISDDLVFNCLVDIFRIDVKALATSKEESEEILLIKESNGREFIRGGKVKEVFFLPNGDYWQVKNGNRIMVHTFTRNITSCMAYL